jgi:CRP/FNR family cyclic AMP-dependent transcriptional regulator
MPSLGLPAGSVLTYVAKRGLALRFRKRQIVFLQGSSSNSLFFLNHGVIKLTVSSENGKEVIVDVVGPGQFFGEDGLISDGESRRHSAVCLTDVQVAKIDCILLSEDLKVKVDIAYAFVDHLLRRNSKLEERLANSLLCPSAKRLMHALASVVTEQRLGRLPRLSQQTLAEMIGTSRQYVNVLLKELRRSTPPHMARIRVQAQPRNPSGRGAPNQ